MPPTIHEETPLLLDNKRPNPSSADENAERTPTLLAVSYASMSGILSGMCLIFAKSGVELLVLTATGDNQFTRWQSWMLLLGLVIFALLQVGFSYFGCRQDRILILPLM